MSPTVDLDPAALWAVVQPLPIVFRRDDLHAILFIEGHSEVESVEALIRWRSGMEPLVKAILTRHDQTQVDYISDIDVAARMQHRDLGRATHHAYIEHARDGAQVAVAFSSASGERVEMVILPLGDPSAQWAGLKDPGRHGDASALPIMVAHRSAPAAPESRVTIGGVPYRVASRSATPGAPAGLLGYVSRDFCLGVLVATRRDVTLVSAPAAIRSGGQWIYRDAEGERAYAITQVWNNDFLVERAGERILMACADGRLGVERILLPAEAAPGRPGSTLGFHFKPALPLFSSAEEGSVADVGFSVSVDHLSDLVTGTVTVCRREGALALRLAPAHPAWAARRVVSARIHEAQRGQFTCVSSILPGA